MGPFAVPIQGVHGFAISETTPEATMDKKQLHEIREVREQVAELFATALLEGIQNGWVRAEHKEEKPKGRRSCR